MPSISWSNTVHDVYVSLLKPNEMESFNLMWKKCHIPEIYKGSIDTLCNKKKKDPYTQKSLSNRTQSFALHFPSQNITTPGLTTTHDIHGYSGPPYSVPKYFCPKWLGATGWTSDVRMVTSGNLFRTRWTASIENR